MCHRVAILSQAAIKDGYLDSPADLRLGQVRDEPATSFVSLLYGYSSSCVVNAVASESNSDPFKWLVTSDRRLNYLSGLMAEPLAPGSSPGLL